MTNDASKTGMFLSALSAAALGVSVFLPWYGLTLTASGAEAAKQGLSSVAQQFGNTAFQSQAEALGSRFSALSGQELGTLSAHQALTNLNVVLLILAALAFLAALAHLAGAAEVGKGQIALVGSLATLCVLFRMIDPPAPQEGTFTMSLAWGIWVALISAVAIIFGDVWSRRNAGTESSGATFAGPLDGASEWSAKS